MVDRQLLRSAQLKMLEILQAVDAICQEHGIRYWLFYGTLLGAVRYQGFIPWDDDCDICMMRADYEKFEQYIAELPDNMFLQTKQTDANYPKNIRKIRMLNTKIVELSECENEKYHQGIFVDVFVWDYHPYPGKAGLAFLNSLCYFKKMHTELPKGSLKRALVQICAALPYALFSGIRKTAVWVSPLFRKNEKFAYMGNEYTIWSDRLYKKEYVFPLRRDISFEGLYLSTPNDYDKLLTIRYGEYMVPPPENERHFHAKRIEI